MQFEKSCLEFELASLDESRVLLRSWNRVLARHGQRGARTSRLTEEHLVNISLDDRQRPEELVVMQFMAPTDLLNQLVAELKAVGYPCPVVRAIQGFWTRYRLHVTQQ